MILNKTRHILKFHKKMTIIFDFIFGIEFMTSDIIHTNSLVMNSNSLGKHI